MRILGILIGTSMIFFGRRLFWLFVGAAGFIFGIHVARLLLHGQPEWAVVALALSAGLLGAFLAIFLQRSAIAAAGFVLGAYVLSWFVGRQGWETEHLYWIMVLVGGIAGLLLVSVLFDWALIILSSVSGAILIVEPLDLHGGMPVRLLLGSLLIAAGIGIQAGLMHNDSPGGR
jgi:hypothetical protein